MPIAGFMECFSPSVPSWESPAYIESSADRKGSRRQDKIGSGKDNSVTLGRQQFNLFSCLAKIPRGGKGNILNGVIYLGQASQHRICRCGSFEKMTRFRLSPFPVPGKTNS